MSSTLIADRYRVMERIGQGGMGSVYRAEHVHMKKVVAIKVLHRALTQQSEAVARFEREAIAAGNIDHPNIAKATDFGRLPDGSFFLVLEYVQGKTLHQVLHERTLRVEEALEIAKQISSALSAAHAVGVVHRDLKPDNVMLVERPLEPDLVKVLDFGIAKVGTLEQAAATRTPITRMGSVFGTPEYMAPEQASGGAVDLRADLYALGIVLYRMLSGREPFVDEDVSKVLMQQVTKAPPPLPVALSHQIKSLVLDLLNKDPARRVQTADAAYTRIVYCQVQHSGARASGWQQMWARIELFRLKNRASLGTGRWSQRALALKRRFQHWQQFLMRPVTLRGQTFKVWQLVLAVGGVLGAALVGIAVGAGTPQASTEKPATPAARVGSSPLLDHAIAGVPSAIAELEQRPPSQRSTEEWIALAQGRVALGRYSGAIEAYQEAVLRMPSLADSPEVAHDVWLAAQRPDVAPQALRFAAHHLGAKGADLLYKVWIDLSKAVTPTTTLARELLLDSGVQKEVSPALRIALELRAAEGCDSLSKLLPKAMLQGDARSGRILRRVQNEEQCPELTAQLEAALAKVKDRPEPRF